MVKTDLGTKRACPSCNVRFYDLGKRPIECPKCGTSFEPESLYKQRRSRVAEPVGASAAVKSNEDEDDEENEDEDEDAQSENDDADEIEEAPLKTTATGENEDGDNEEDEVEEDEEEDEDTHGGMRVVNPEGSGEDDLEDIEVDDDEDDDEEEEDDHLLGEVEDEDDDVSGIIDADIRKDEN